MGHSSIDVIKLNIGTGFAGIAPGRYAVIKEAEWEDFVAHYNEVYSEREQAIDLGMKINEGTKYNDSMVKFVRWVFSCLKEIMRAGDHNVRMELPSVKEFLDKLYELRLADQTYASPCEEGDDEHEYTPMNSQWQIHLAFDLKEEHEHGSRAGDCEAEESPETAESGEGGPEEGTL